jgi:hypothetical protein
MSVTSLIAVAGVVALATLGSLAAVADDADDTGGGYPIQVTVLPSTPTATPSPTPTPTKASTAGSTTTTTTGATSAPVPSPTPTAAQLDTQSVDGSTIGGALYVSGLRTTYIPSLDPSAGVIRSSFVIKNVSEQSIDSSVTFRLTNFLGQELSSVDRIYILNLEAGETKEIDADLERPGQWAFTTASFTLSPTSLVDGQRLPEYTRDTVVFCPPWLVVVFLVLAAAAYIIVRIVRASRSRSVEAYG